MAEPSMELDTHNEKTSLPTYDLAIINGNTVDSTITLRFGGSDSADGAITNVTLPSSGNKWAEDLWYEDSDGIDEQLSDENTTPDAASQCYYLFKLTSDAVAYASAPIITCYDSGASRTGTEEALAGTTNHTSTFMKIVGATISGQPAQYWGAGSSAALHALETGGSVTLGSAAQGLNADTAYMTCTTTDINGTPQYFSIAMSVPDDATTGTDAVDIVLSIKYTYT